MSLAQDLVYEPFAGEQDLDLMLSLIEKDLSEPYSVYTYRFFLHNWPELAFNCKVKTTGQLIGTIIGKIQPHKKGKLRGYIGMLAVHEDWRRRGIAKELVLHLVRQMKVEGAEEIVLETEITNVKALNLYQNLGFYRDKYLLRYYFNGSDAYRLKFALNTCK